MPDTMMPLTAFLGMTLLALTSPAAAFFQSGNTIYEDCQARDGICMAYVVGVIDGDDTFLGVHYCLPVGSTQGQVRDVFANYLDDHPEERHLPAEVLVLHSMIVAFPCP